MRIGLILSILIILCRYTFAGNYSFSVETGYGSYSMHSLDELQKYLIDYYRFGNIVMKRTESFPPYYFYKFNLIRHSDNRLGFGVRGDYATTGGRLTYSDYSGHHTSDQIVGRYAVGLHAEYKYPLSPVLSWQIYTDAVLIFSTLKLKEVLQIFEESQSGTKIYNSISFGLVPGISLQLDRGKFFARLNTGYELNTNASLLPKDNGSVLRTPTNGDINANWSGWRISLGLGMYF